MRSENFGNMILFVRQMNFFILQNSKIVRGADFMKM